MIDFSAPLDDVVLRWPTPESRRWVIDFIQKASNAEKVTAVVALGSAIRPSVESEDVDLLVLCRESDRCSFKAPIEIDLRVYAEEEVDEALNAGADLLTWAVRFGQVLYERDHAWSDLVESWKHRVRLPDPDVAERRARVAQKQLDALEQAGDATAANELRVSMLTHRARAALSRSGVFPASRPEMVGQLREIGRDALALRLESALRERHRLAGESVVV